MELEAPVLPEREIVLGIGIVQSIDDVQHHRIGDGPTVVPEGCGTPHSTEIGVDGEARARLEGGRSGNIADLEEVRGRLPVLPGPLEEIDSRGLVPVHCETAQEPLERDGLDSVPKTVDEDAHSSVGAPFTDRRATEGEHLVPSEHLASVDARLVEAGEGRRLVSEQVAHHTLSLLLVGIEVDRHGQLLGGIPGIGAGDHIATIVSARRRRGHGDVGRAAGLAHEDHHTAKERPFIVVEGA